MKQYSEHNFEQCTKCTVCTVYCPVAAVNPLYPGPKQAGPDGERLRMKSGPSISLMMRCSISSNITSVLFAIIHFVCSIQF